MSIDKDTKELKPDTIYLFISKATHIRWIINKKDNMAYVSYASSGYFHSPSYNYISNWYVKDWEWYELNGAELVIELLKQ